MRPAVDVFKAAAQLTTSEVDDAAEYRNGEGARWTRYSSKKGLVKAEYDIPVGNDEVELAMQRCIGTDNLFMAYVRLDFFTLPMWPTTPADYKSPFDSIFYSCLECGQFVGPYAQLCMQFFLPSIVEATRKAKDTGAYPWSWLPRLICESCTTYLGADSDETLTYYPFCMYAHRTIGRALEGCLKKMRSERAIHYISGAGAPSKEASTCLMCSKPIHKKKKRRKHHPYCSAECRHFYDTMKELQGLYGDCENQTVTGLFQLLELFDVLQAYDIDVNAALAWHTVCNNIERHEQDEHAPRGGGHACVQCHRVTYCSEKCAKDARTQGIHHCSRSWRSILTIDHLCIQRE